MSESDIAALAAISHASVRWVIQIKNDMGDWRDGDACNSEDVALSNLRHKVKTMGMTSSRVRVVKRFTIDTLVQASNGP